MRVLIVGAGIMGITTAYFLQRQGCEVVLLEQQDGPAQGASQANGSFFSAGLSAPWSAPGAIGMALRAQFDPSAAFRWKPDFTWRQATWMLQSMRECHPKRYSLNRARLTRMAAYAQDCLQHIEADLSIDYDRSRQGLMQLYREAVPQSMVDAHLAYLDTMNIRARYLTPDEVREQEPALRRSTPDLFGAIHLPDDLSGDCAHFAQKLLGAVRARGATFVCNAKVQEVRIDASGPSRGRVSGLATTQGDFDADAYVFAAGVESAVLLRGLANLPIYPIKGYSVTAHIRNADAAPRHSMFDFKAKTGMARMGERMRISGIAEVAGYGLQISRARCEQLMKAFEEAFPDAIDAASATFWTGLRPATPDGVPCVCTTDFRNLYINAGHGGSGWSMSCGSGKLMADIVLGRTTDIDAQDYALLRRR
ncbi:D-amino acid dehydrogenase [Variovorax sp. J31P207]|uniref:D-amino acid dehydrogenase n=1 Tax=Variovorax sp. J31P207 TaxID=3053510 RepID=UPI0025769710|nr:D-amino acid dehydrogenase [Variovorax sp. J31P207]MDM0069333.1 D-amino acid dehydrogenase [Variovorax sp. J31P207]